MDKTTAEKQIAATLEALERSSGGVVQAVTFEDIESTSFEDREPVFQRRVFVDLQIQPRHRWVK